MGRMGGVLHNIICFAGALCKENVQDGGERGTDDLCSCVHCPLEGLLHYSSRTRQWCSWSAHSQWFPCRRWWGWVKGDLLFSAGWESVGACAFLESDMVLVVQVRFELWMASGWWATEFLLKSITTSFVFPTLRDRLLAPHHSASCATSSLYCVSSLLLMRPTTDVSSANLMMWLELNLAVLCGSAAWRAAGWAHLCSVW